MAVRVKYRAMDLSAGEHEVFALADAYEVLEDNTVILYSQDHEARTKRRIGAVHRDRWESVQVLENSNA